MANVSQKFRAVHVWPDYGLKKAVVTWEVDPSILSGDFYVYRSPDGTGEWELLNTDKINGLILEDDSFSMTDRTRVPHYRVLCEHGGEEYESPVIGLFETLTRKEMGFINKAKHEELLRMRGGNGLQVFFYPARIGGLPCSYVDKETEVHHGHGCAGTEDDCYGTGLIGGWRKPMVLWAELYKQSPQAGSQAKENVGQTDDRTMTIRLLTPFVPQVGDMIVLPRTDDRFLVGEQTTTHKFKGVAPLATDVTAEMLPRNHDAYRLIRPQGVL